MSVFFQLFKERGLEFIGKPVIMPEDFNIKLPSDLQ